MFDPLWWCVDVTTPFNVFVKRGWWMFDPLWRQVDVITPFNVFVKGGWRIYDLFWIQDIKVAYILTSTNSTWVGTDDDDDDDGDDDDDCKCGAASGLDGNSVVKFGIVNDIALLTLPYNSPLAWEHDKIWKCTVKPLGFEVELLMLYYCFPYNTHRIHVWYMC